MPWNKVKDKSPNRNLYSIGSGFSKIIQLANKEYSLRQLKTTKDNDYNINSFLDNSSFSGAFNTPNRKDLPRLNKQGKSSSANDITTEECGKDEFVCGKRLFSKEKPHNPNTNILKVYKKLKQ